MSRKKLIAGNWKLNMKQSETKEFLTSLIGSLNSSNLKEVEVMVCPTFTSLNSAADTIKTNKANIILGAQDLSQYSSGAYTGEISAAMLQEIGVEYVLVGHSERREYFKEDDSVINAKLKAALSAGLKVVLCCGESESTRDSGKTDSWVSSQIESALQGIESSGLATKIAVAYEPIWAIGTGKVCESSEANRVIKVIRDKLNQLIGNTEANAMRILYGGSVKAKNAEEILGQSDIDGCLVGGASIIKEEITAIIAAAAKLKVSL